MSILEEIKKERARQDAKWGEQNHKFTTINEAYAKNIADICREQCDEQFALGEGTWQDILEEEVYEALAEASKGDMKAFREELIQVAAVVVAMIECVDRNNT